MSKAILVLDEMPGSCCSCPLHNYHFCNITDEPIDEDHRPNHCQLKSLPNKKETAFCNNMSQLCSFHGWNNCLSEILGE